MASAYATIVAPSDAKSLSRSRMAPRGEAARLKRLWSEEFRDGARCAFLRQFDGDREAGGYPRGFHRWSVQWTGSRSEAREVGYLLGANQRSRVGAH
jgi:hypothetical protein